MMRLIIEKLHTLVTLTVFKIFPNNIISFVNYNYVQSCDINVTTLIFINCDSQKTYI